MHRKISIGRAYFKTYRTSFCLKMGRLLTPHLHTWIHHCRILGPAEPPEDGEMNETLPCRKRIKIRSFAVWDRERYISVTEVHHNTTSLRVSGKETVVSLLGPDCQSGCRTRDLQLSKQAASTTTPGPPIITYLVLFIILICA